MARSITTPDSVFLLCNVSATYGGRFIFIMYNKIKMPKINFKRKKSGDGAWGAGLDYLFKDSWNDLDKIVEDNYYGRHNQKLINPLFLKIFSALEEAILLMKNSNWTRKARFIQKFGSSAKTLNEKVIFIDSVVQFLRETS